MAETYCGKSCGDCTRKAELNCSGCKSGPGKWYGGDCKLAKCARDKGHETCETCGLRDRCGTHRSREDMPDDRIRRIAAEEKRKAAIAKRAPVLGKWLWIMFWLNIPGNIGSLMMNDSTVNVLPGLFVPGLIISAICSFIYGAILLKLGSEEDRYRTAGTCVLIVGVFNALTAMISAGSEGSNWMLTLKVLALVVALVGEYNEYVAHSAVLSGVDNELSQKWEVLWKWYIGLLLGTFGCLFVALILPILGAIAALGCSVGSIVVGILKLVYLYRTAKEFREYPAGVR